MVSAIPSTVNETQTAIIQCKVLAANPVPSLVIRNANGLSITHTNGNVTLSSVTADQDGMYTCAASNGIGQPVTGNTTLTVNREFFTSKLFYFYSKSSAFLIFYFCYHCVN